MGKDNRRHRLRIATATGFSPNRLGSGESAIVAFAQAVRERGHSWTLFTWPPVHPSVKDALNLEGVRWESLQELERRPLAALRRLSRNFDVVELNLIPPRSRIAVSAYCAWPCKVVFRDHVSGPAPEQEGRRRLAALILDRVTMLRVAQLAGVSEYVRARDQRRFGLPVSRTAVVYNAVDTERFAPPASPRLREGLVNLLAVAALIPEKGLHVLLRALAGVRTRHWHLKIAGEGPEAGRLGGLISELSLSDEVDLLGRRDDVENLMKEADVFLHPATWSEAFGLTVVEGMASGCAVLASRVGGIPELLEHGVEGLLVNPGSVEDWTRALQVVMADGPLRARLGTAARERAVRDFELATAVRARLDWLEVVATGRPVRY